MNNAPIETPWRLNRRRLLQAAPTGLIGWFAAGGTLLADPAAADSPWPGLIAHSVDPPNAEPAVPTLIRNWVTPLEHFYIRSHAVAPEIDPGKFRLKVEGLVRRPTEFSLAELLGRFRRTETMATMCCAGNRREEHSLIKPVDGVQWRGGALGNALWSGVSLADVLRAVEIADGAKHVWFEGLDPHEKRGEQIIFGGSIPLSRALAAPAGAEPLLCDRMNGQPLTPDHGYPLRTVVPGYIGARSVKWLGRIVVSDRPSENHYLATAYKLVTESTPDAWSQAPALMSLPLQSYIGSMTSRGDGNVRVRGYALPPGYGDGLLQRVELSSDGGTNWKRARITSEQRRYCWVLWEADVPAPNARAEIVVRAVDSEGRGQPEKAAWNLKGYMFNAWHRKPLRQP